MAVPKIAKPDMNMSLLMLGLVILVLGNIYYTYRQFNELNYRIQNINRNIVNNEEINEENNEESNENPLKNIFIHPINEKVSENIETDIQLVDEEDINEEELDLNMDINFKELDNELENINMNDEKDIIVNKLNEKSKKDLIELAEENNLSKSGTKQELVNRLVESNVEIGDSISE
jgi:hypothetical protein